MTGLLSGASEWGEHGGGGVVMKQLSWLAFSITALSIGARWGTASVPSPCDLNYVADSSTFLVETFEELQPSDLPDGKFPDAIRAALPDVKRVFYRRGVKHTALVGWTALPEDYSALTASQ